MRDIYPTMETAREAFEKDDLFVDEEEGTVVATARINQEQVPEYARVDWEYPAKDEGRDGAAHPGSLSLQSRAGDRHQI